MQLQQAHRKQAKMRLAIQGCSGSGKTYSSLLLAFGMTNDWQKIAVIDTEHGSSNLYSDLGQYNVLSLTTPYSPERYMEAIEVCEKAGMEVIIIDSLSHCWEYLLDIHSNMTGNSFTNWGKITPLQNAVIQKILSSSCHIITTMRTKQDYVLSDKNGKMTPEKVGLKAVMRDGVDYEHTIVFDIDIKHRVSVSKDRTGMFTGKPDFIITTDVGKRILEWCNTDVVTIEDVKAEIQKTTIIDDLYTIYNKHPEWREILTPDFMTKKQALQSMQSNNQTRIINQNNLPRYGNNAITSRQN